MNMPSTLVASFLSYSEYTIFGVIVGVKLSHFSKKPSFFLVNLDRSSNTMKFIASLLPFFLMRSVDASLLFKTIELETVATVVASDAVFDESAAEIGAYDKKTKRIFVSNGQSNRIDVWDISEPSEPAQLDSIDLSTFGGGPNSVAVGADGLLAVAVQNTDVQSNGRVVFFDTENYATAIQNVEVGALPDMITFAPNGKTLLVANEGEPNDDYTIDPEGSVSIIHTDIVISVDGGNVFEVKTLDFTDFNDKRDELQRKGVRIFGPSASVAQDLEPEYITVSKDGKYAFVSLQENNAMIKIDLYNEEIIDIYPLGFKDHSASNNAFDASDRDDGIIISAWPVLGMYQPDSIAAFEIDGHRYIATANEGDARDYAGFSEESRVEDLTLDSDAFPTGDNLKLENNLGRLTVTTTLGDSDNDSDYDALYAFGTRSFSIWDENLNLVYDSGSDFEVRISQLFPEIFNTNNDEVNPADGFDSRSDAKGPEPEAIAVGKIGDKTYAFIGLERVGGIMVYDVSCPETPEFVEYVRTDGDLGPEGIVFIPAEDSPLKEGIFDCRSIPMLVVTNEVSGTTTLYRINTKLAWR